MTLTRDVLPTWVKPTHYDLTIKPDLETFQFSGHVHINCNVVTTTKKILLNVKEVQVSSAKVKVVVAKTETTQEAKITYDTSKEHVIFDFEQDIPAGAAIVLTCHFTGIHNDKMAGFYRSGYTDQEGKKKHLVVTQFEATDARRCFPCWDEPNVKATFDITLVVPSDRTALSNMNVIDEKVEGSLKTVKFATTPIMSTYLVAMAVGEFEYIESVAHPKSPANAKPITCRTYTLKGQTAQGKFGLDVCVKTLEFFSEYFDIAYPLPKMDLIAIPDFGAGAMENWGLVTYREIYLLYDEKSSSSQAKQRIAYVVCHELAHQWFGNLVTMDWWSELWLNEGFATFVGWLAVNHSFPEWNIWTSFVTDDFSNGLKLDSLRSSHPIEVDVKSPEEINQIFDAISYSKGASVIRMLNSFLTGEKFMNGVRAYLKKHSYGNATTQDLWHALETASGLPVAELMHTWTREMGYPVVSVVGDSTKDGQLTLEVEQSRFLSSGATASEKHAQKWMIPISIATKEGVTQHLLKDTRGTFTCPCRSHFKLNHSTTGFYRVQYREKDIKQIAAALKDKDAFTNEDRIGLLADSFALAKAGLSSTADSLELAKGFTEEDNYMVLDELNTRLNSVLSVWFKESEDVQKGIKQLIRTLFSAKAQKIGYEYPKGEDHLTSLKRTLVISAAANAGDDAVIAELTKRFNSFVGGDESALHPNIRGIAYATVLKNSKEPEKTFNAVVNIYKTAPTIDQKLAALGSFGSVNDISLVKRILDTMVLDGDFIKPQDVHYPLTSLAHRSPIKAQVLPIMWEWLQKNWEELHARFAASLSLLGHCLKACSETQLGEDFAKTVEAWAQGEGLSAEAKAKRADQLKVAKRPLEQALENIRSNTQWLSRDRDAVAKWVSKA